MTKPKMPLSALTALEHVRHDIREMETHSVDGVYVLVPKADVLEIVQDWIEYCLNPEQTVLARWMAVAFSSGKRHAIPINDLQQHEETLLCWCKPVTVRGVWAHNSADGREKMEAAEQ